MATPIHIPVLVDQVVELLRPCSTGILVDCTVGLGGHAGAILQAYPELCVLGLDVDPEALEIAQQRLRPWGKRVDLVCHSYTRLDEILDKRQIQPTAVLFDLGVSSLQLESPHRGFSFRLEGPLDMRFSKEGKTLAEVLAQTNELELASWLARYGEERRAYRIARAILRQQQQGQMATTTDLRRAVWSVTGPPRGRLDPATKTFQALRIVTNNELSGILQALEVAAERLKPFGRLLVLAYHSLEDRIVKNTFRRLSGTCVCAPGTTTCTCDRREVLRIVTKKPITAPSSEVAKNPRARSAKLRAAERKP